MMKIFFSTTLLIIFSYFSNAQKSNDTVFFIGGIQLKNNINISYSLTFKILSDNSLKGYSITDINGSNQTKTAITGSYNPNKGTLSFFESAILNTKVNLKEEELCFVHAQLKFKSMGKAEVLQGAFIGKKKDGKSVCANGQIKMLNVSTARSKLEDLIARNAEQIELNKQGNDINKKINDKVFVYEAIDQPVFNASGQNLKISIVDKGELDGDSIALMINNKVLLNNYAISEVPKILNVKLSAVGQYDTLKLIALNEGSRPPNSATLTVEDQKSQYPLQIRVNKNKIKRFVIKRID